MVNQLSFTSYPGELQNEDYDERDYDWHPYLVLDHKVTISSESIGSYLLNPTQKT